MEFWSADGVLERMMQPSAAMISVLLEGITAAFCALTRSTAACSTAAPSHCRPFHCRPFHCRPFHCRPFHCRPFHCRPFHCRLFHACVPHQWPVAMPPSAHCLRLTFRQPVPASAAPSF
ncbi:hypothetical protein CLOM_g12000 [Closterium sp. NIES-68]|nr:hypothetical protein CLOM_g12000 [Closterium sp. NIES-68]